VLSKGRAVDREGEWPALLLAEVEDDWARAVQADHWIQRLFVLWVLLLRQLESGADELAVLGEEDYLEGDGREERVWDGERREGETERGESVGRREERVWDGERRERGTERGESVGRREERVWDGERRERGTERGEGEREREKSVRRRGLMRAEWLC
jgi:hypothetical protein